GSMYRHRASTNGDLVAGCLIEDLVNLGRSHKLVRGVARREHVLNKQNRAIGRSARRGDGTFGERVPSVPASPVAGSNVAVGAVATIEIGMETKILAKAMIKQIGRVCSDMRHQAVQFRRAHSNVICVGIVGINHGVQYTGYEGAKTWPTDGRKHK